MSGSADRGNGLDGINIDNSANNVIGGLTPAERNVISGNSTHGVRIIGESADNNIIQGNYIGLKAAGTAAIGNTYNGLIIYNGADNNLVGGTALGAGNVVSGNTGAGQGSGVVIFGSNATGNLVQNNYIGTDITGTLDHGNKEDGVLISDRGDGGVVKGAASGNTVRGNVLSGNDYSGVSICNSGVNNNLILGNYIGVDAAGSGALGNSVFGVVIWNGADGNRVGAVNAGDGNVIAFNNRGVLVDDNSTAAMSNSIRGNSIHSNTALGIDLDNDGVTANDLGDGDVGPNGLRNYPVLTNAAVVGPDLSVAGTLNSLPSLNHQLDFYWSPAGDPSGHGEGQTYIGSTNVTSDFAGHAGFNTTFVGVSVPVGAVITATATDAAGNTSEFSLNRTAINSNTAPVLNPAASPVLAAVIEDAGAPSGVVGTLVSALVDFAIPAGQVDNVTDPDAGALLGIAVTAANTANGTWWYSTNNGSTWNVLGAVANNNARLLTADASTRLYFQPHADYNDTLASAVTFRAWDQTSGTNGTFADASTNGGITAYSTATDTASLVITAVNDAPVITSNGGGATAAVNTAENGTAVTTVIATDADLPAQTLTYSINGGADAARFTVDGATGVLRFLAAPNYEAPTDTGANNVYDVTVQVSDGTLIDAQTIAVTVTSVNDAPVASDDSYTVNGDSTLNVAALGVLANDSDVEGDTLTALLVHGRAQGNVTFNPDGSFTYTPHADFIGTDRVGYCVSDGMLTSDVAVVSVVVNPGLQFFPPAEDNQVKPQRSGEEPTASDSSEAPEAEAATKADNTNGGEAAPPSPGAVPGPHAQVEVTPEAAGGQDPAVHGQDEGEIVSGSSESNVIPRPASDAARVGNLRSIKTAIETSSPGDRGTSAGRYRTEVATQQYAHIAGPGQLWRELDDFEKTVDSPLQFNVVAVGSVGTIASGFTVGYVLWVLRSGLLLSSLLASLPAWTLFDPLAIVSTGGGIVGDDEAEESLEELVENRAQKVSEVQRAEKA